MLRIFRSADDGDILLKDVARVLRDRRHPTVRRKGRATGEECEKKKRGRDPRRS
jgi:hypothetical protein